RAHSDRDQLDVLRRCRHLQHREKRPVGVCCVRAKVAANVLVSDHMHLLSIEGAVQPRPKIEPALTGMAAPPVREFLRSVPKQSVPIPQCPAGAHAQVQSQNAPCKICFGVRWESAHIVTSRKFTGFLRLSAVYCRLAGWYHRAIFPSHSPWRFLSHASIASGLLSVSWSISRP